MFITSREKSIIELIVKTSGKHTVYSLSAFLNVSGRTVQRNLKSIESILKQYHLELKRTANEGLFIDGKNEHIYRLIQNLADVSPTDETPEERKLNLLIILLHEGPSFKKQVLASQLGISVTTLSSYLDELADWLQKYGITLTRKRGVGVELVAEEADKRHALASFFLVHFYEDIIETLYGMQKGHHLDEPVLGYFKPDYLLAVDQVVNHHLADEQITLTDSDYIGLVVHICLTVQRSEKGFGLQQREPSEEEAPGEFQLMDRICRELTQRLSVSINHLDVQFLTVILKGSKVQDPEVVYYDSILLGHLIKNVIKDVSADLHVDLSDDFSLFQGLLAHMGPSIFRLQQELDLFNPLTDEIRKKYPVLFLAVKKSLEMEFKDISFPDDEVAFIVLHFGSAMLMNEEKVNIQAVVVCPTGIGTSKMLASRIQRELSMINKVEILSIKDFQNADLEEYDIVISTVRLPFTEVEYILVSPLLSEKDIGFIQSYLQNNVEKLTRKKYLKPSPKSDGKGEVRMLLQEIKDVHSSMEAILTNFRVYRKQSAGNHVRILSEMVEQADRDGLLQQPQAVLDQLMEREKKGGLGIPNTNMGLFHCRDHNVNKLIFQVAHLDEPCKIKGMDGAEMEMKSLLLMLAPEELSRREQEILSLISTSLIEDHRSMMIYSSTNEAIILKKLEEIFLDYLQTNLIKE
ncbi:BglG family transcriptional antiterminator [Bacillus sp. V-88]|uniref:BglG family transcription antiterminator n=1 Tax=Rossellomorea vietnamensis TaxID=218284 RepID=UPI000558D7A0|nr:BglG family transcription antiterminator [Rossellomorea vietnamensis]OXS63796.1 sugar transporter [Bacillus sp. DSM 27956]PRX78871.1 BglG family transcriptional antiterminator [Bacillus sp. V-88]SLK14367.1 transcriptional antiterminator, BglG family [Bacillus sp. V-88]